MAYGGGAAGGTNTTQVYRMRRNTPYTKGGYIQPSIPQFKGLYTYTPAPGATTNPHLVPVTFRQTMTYTRNRWPVSPGKQVTSGS